MSTTTIQDIYRRMAPTGAGSVSVITATDIAVRVRDEAVDAERERVIEALITKLREARAEVERTRLAAGAPYASNDTIVAYQKALGVQQGIGVCLDVMGQLEADR